MKPFSPHRLRAIIAKEFIQMRRDRATLAMMLGIPVMQMILFGFAINMDPKHLPTAVIAGDHGPYTRSLAAAMQNSDYFHFVDQDTDEATANTLLRRGEVNFVLTIPPSFNRDLARGLRPTLLLEADATDPAAIGNAVSAMQNIMGTAFNRDLAGPLETLRQSAPPAGLRTHLKYNPEKITQYNIVPGLIGVILTMTMVFITALAITREKEHGTMENLLSTPVRPAEVMIGKIIPYILVGYVQVTLILLGARFLFQVPVEGNLLLLIGIALLFIIANLSVGVTFSSIASNQLQAVQLSIFFFLPSMLLSGFMFPFSGMPVWAQFIGNILPLTHFLPIVRGIMLKGNGIADIHHHIYALLAFMFAALFIGIKKFRQTLD
jgi:ABC-2 type transport system permease protein